MIEQIYEPRPLLQSAEAKTHLYASVSDLNQ